MKKTGRKSLGAVLLLLGLTLSACGQAEAPSGNAESGSAPKETVTLQKHDPASQQPTQEAEETLQEGNASIPVLVGGALPFTGMQNVKLENHADGTYFYEDQTEDTLTHIINEAYPSQREAYDEAEDYIAACAANLTEYEIHDLSIQLDETCTAHLSYPAYKVTFLAGSNEDTTSWTALITDTDVYTYVYAFQAYMDADEGMEEIYQNIFQQLTLFDPNSL